MINIILADDHQIVRKGLQAILKSEPDFEVIGEARDGLEAVQTVIKLQPDILVLDLMMDGINGLEVTRQLHKKCIKTGIVILSMHSNEAYVLEALRSGAKAYILKDNTTDDLVRAIREVAAGRRYLSAPLSERAIEAFTQQIETSSNDPYDNLTTREREIFQLVAQGWSNADIAERLYISARTVETHRANLMRKLGFHTHTELLQFAMLRGIIPGSSKLPQEN
jgi:two-component system, NarL family, response regulator NreC